MRGLSLRLGGSPQHAAPRRGARCGTAACRVRLAAVSPPYRVRLAAVSPPQPAATLRTLPHRPATRGTPPLRAPRAFRRHPAASLCCAVPPCCPTVALYRAVPPSRGAHSAPLLRAIRTAAACCATPPLAPHRSSPAPRYHRPPYRPRHATIARHTTHRARYARHAPRRCIPSGTTARRPARIRAPTFSTARRNALPK